MYSKDYTEEEGQRCKMYLLKQARRYCIVWGSEGITLCMLNLCTRWRWVISFTPWPI